MTADNTAKHAVMRDIMAHSDKHEAALAHAGAEGLLDLMRVCNWIVPDDVHPDGTHVLTSRGFGDTDDHYDGIADLIREYLNQLGQENKPLRWLMVRVNNGLIAADLELPDKDGFSVEWPGSAPGFRDVTLYLSTMQHDDGKTYVYAVIEEMEGDL